MPCRLPVVERHISLIELIPVARRDTMKDPKTSGIALLLVSALVLSAQAVAIENGLPDPARRAIGSVGFDIDGSDGPAPPLAICSGFVISDRAFVTAAHCIAQPRTIR